MRTKASEGHRKILASLGKDIAGHEAELAELRLIKDKLIRSYERNKNMETIAFLTAELEKFRMAT
jgi:predicted transcriptional regulator